MNTKATFKELLDSGKNTRPHKGKSRRKKASGIGEKIKLLRADMPQAELARRCGIDKAIISKIENNKMLGTVESHRKIAHIFGLNLAELYSFTENDKKDMVEHHPGHIANDVYQDFLEILTKSPLSKRMLPTLLVLSPGQERFLEETLKKVERFIFVLKGAVKIEIEGKSYTLKKKSADQKGDSLYSRSSKRHNIKNAGKEKARLLCVSSPPVL